jgi:hypothetical protein
MKTKAITLVEAPHKKSICETKMRYSVMLHGKYYGELYFNMTGYVGYLPTADGMQLSIGEKSISVYKKEIAVLNREFEIAGK